MKKKYIILSVACAAVIAGIIWLLYVKGFFLPGWIEWNNKATEYSGRYEIILADKKVTVTDKGDKQNNIADNGVPVSSPEEIWHSSDSLLVSDYLIADITGDGKEEMVLLCWRRARFGPHQPFFIKGNDKTWSQHIAVYAFDENENSFRSIWTASDIGLLAKDWKYDDIHNRLIIQDINDEVTAWIWPGFGFMLADSSVSFAACGDNLIHDTIYEYGLEKRDSDFSFLYDNISKRLSEADVRILNLETILVDDPKDYSGFPAFGTPVEVGMAAKEAGFDIFTCATNHALDKGMIGIDTTASFCDENDITYLGIQPSEEKERVPYKVFWKKGYSFAMFNYTMGLSNTNSDLYAEATEYAVAMLNDDNREQIVSDLTEAQNVADAVIVFVHWGTEDSGGIDEFQKKWAEIFNDCGVDVVVGTHPHVLQPVERLINEVGNETLIYYSLGNLVSSQRGEDNRLGGIAEFDFEMTMDGIKVASYDMAPVVTHHGTDGITTCYYVDDYTDEIAAQKPQNLKKEELMEKYNRIRID